MTNPPGMVVDASGEATSILVVLWNYTDQEIKVNLQLTYPTPAPGLGVATGVSNYPTTVPPNSTPETAGNSGLATPAFYTISALTGSSPPEPLNDGEYSLAVQIVDGPGAGPTIYPVAEVFVGYTAPPPPPGYRGPQGPPLGGHKILRDTPPMQ